MPFENSGLHFVIRLNTCLEGCMQTFYCIYCERYFFFFGCPITYIYIYYKEKCKQLTWCFFLGRHTSYGTTPSYNNHYRRSPLVPLNLRCSSICRLSFSCNLLNSKNHHLAHRLDLIPGIPSETNCHQGTDTQSIQ
jgi:hypothetical protein